MIENEEKLFRFNILLDRSPYEDKEKLIESIEKTKNVITIEDGFIKGGLATTVNELIAKNGIIDVNIKNCGYDDEFVKQGSVQELEQINGLDCNSIVASWVKNEIL